MKPSPTTLRKEPFEISPLDEQFGRLLVRLGGVGAEVQRVAQLASAALRAGHTCLPLTQAADSADEVDLLAQSLRASGIVGSPGEWQPLILDVANRLYLQRYWQYEQQLAAALRERINAPHHEIDTAWLDVTIDRLLPLIPGKTEDQRKAVLAALSSRFCVITGGPGTGKTRTVAVVVALLHERARHLGLQAPQVALAAPTGKAAARMSEALQAALSESPLRKSVEGMPVPSATTLHRLLGMRPDSPSPRYGAGNPLAADVVIVDEASMIDLAGMAKLFAATAPEATLLLLGDRDQLASVEAGHVLGDIADAAAGNSAEQSTIVSLRKNFRFSRESGIQQLAEQVNAGDADASLALLEAGGIDGLSAAPLPSPAALPALLRKKLEAKFATLQRITDPADALRTLGAFRILCALRKGPYGVEHINQLCEKALAAAGVLQPGRGNYRGRPIMIGQNDYQLHLFNGDIGVLMPSAEARGELMAFFPAPDGTLRSIHPARLPPHETVWAMTVHKSQGSEFDEVLLILPSLDSPVLSRELVYTGLTRARSSAEIWHHAPITREAILRRTTRWSGLRDFLGS